MCRINEFNEITNIENKIENFCLDKFNREEGMEPENFEIQVTKVVSRDDYYYDVIYFGTLDSFVWEHELRDFKEEISDFVYWKLELPLNEVSIEFDYTR